MISKPSNQNDSDLTPQPTHDKIGTQSGLAATVTDVGIGYDALLGSVVFSFEGAEFGYKHQKSYGDDQSESFSFNRKIVLGN